VKFGTRILEKVVSSEYEFHENWPSDGHTSDIARKKKQNVVLIEKPVSMYLVVCNGT
jgi:hypothetical protein